MKTLLSLMAIVPFFSFAQYNSSQTLNYLMWGPEFIINNNMPYDYYSGTQKRDAVILENRVNTVKTMIIKRNGKKKLVSERRYNADGLPVFELMDKQKTELTYKGKLLTDVVRTKGKQVFKTHAEYDEEGRVIQITKYKNGKRSAAYNYVYYQGNQTSSVEQTNYGIKTRTYTYITEYDDVLKQPTRSQYYINGKLKRNWTYSCDDKGEVMPKNVTEVSSCSYDAKNSDGSYIEYYRTIKEDEVYLIENTFSKDSVLLESKQFYNENVLVFHATYNQPTTISEHFNNHGKRKYKYTNVMDANGNRISWKSYNRKDKVNFGYDCVFGENQLVEKVQYLSDKHYYNFEYTFY